jgi:hypothetical protein
MAYEEKDTISFVIYYISMDFYSRVKMTRKPSAGPQLASRRRTKRQ